MTYTDTNSAVVFASTIVGGRRTPTTTTPVSKGTTTLGNTGGSSTTPTGPQASNTAHSDVQFEGTLFKSREHTKTRKVEIMSILF